MLEAAFTRWFCGELKKVNAYVVALVGSQMQEAGLPDRYACHARWRGWLEFKRDSNPVTGKQRAVLKALSDRGAEALVVRYRNEGDTVSAEDAEGRTLHTVARAEARAAEKPGLVLLSFLLHAVSQREKARGNPRDYGRKQFYPRKNT